MNKTLGSLLLTALLCAPISAWSADINWSFADGGLQYLDPDEGGADSEFGFEFRGSYEINANWYVNGGLSIISYDNSAGDVDLNVLSGGGGYIHQYSPTMDVFGQLNLVRGDIDAGPVNEDDIGIEIKGGVRAIVAPRVEVNGFASLLSIDDPFDDGIEVGGGGVYHFNNQFSAGGELVIESNVVEAKKLYFFGRYHF